LQHNIWMRFISLPVHGISGLPGFSEF
jgi:hypothetical protein